MANLSLHRLQVWNMWRYAPHNMRLERTRHERASLLSCVGEPLKRNVMRLQYSLIWRDLLALHF
jgi:hypothetical protein